MEIAKNYLKTWFLLDLATSLPLDSLLCAANSTSNPGFLRVVKIGKANSEQLGAVNHLKNLPDCHPTVQEWMIAQSQMHLCGCLWMLMAITDLCNDDASKDHEGCVCDSEGCYPNNWLASYDLHMYESIATDSDLFSRYLVSIYFATVTLTTVSVTSADKNKDGLED
eukprot:766421-Hanusia_phi.AAC.4